MYYNNDLAEEQGLSEEEKDELDKTYQKLFDVFEQMKTAEESKDLACLSMKVEELEFELQRIWKFEVDSKKHTYWYRVPQCTCPKYDNKDLFGSEMRIYDTTCPVHKLLLINSQNGTTRH